MSAILDRFSESVEIVTAKLDEYTARLETVTDQRDRLLESLCAVLSEALDRGPETDTMRRARHILQEMKL